MFFILLCRMNLLPQYVDLTFQFFSGNTSLVHALLQFTDPFIRFCNIFFQLFVSGLCFFKILCRFLLLMLRDATFLL